MKISPFLSPPSSALMVLALPLLAQSVSAVALFGNGLLWPGRSSSSSIAPTPTPAPPATAPSGGSGAASSTEGDEENWNNFRGWKRGNTNHNNGVNAAVVNNNNNAGLLKRDDDSPPPASQYGGERNYGLLRSWKREEGGDDGTSTQEEGEADTGADGIEGNWAQSSRGWVKRGGGSDDKDGPEGTGSVDGVEGNWPGNPRGWIKRDDGGLDADADTVAGTEGNYGASRGFVKARKRRDA